MPENYSKYERTGNKALDMVAQAVGWSQKMRRPLKSVTLSRAYYGLFWAGMEILSKKPLPKDHILLFENVVVLRGSAFQFDNIRLEHEKIKMAQA